MPRTRIRLLATLLGAAVAVSMLTACEQQSTEASMGIRVVASTNVYGDLVRTIGSAEVTVTSVIDDPGRDPHEFEADARTQLAVSKADLVVRNGGGYDDFIDTLLDATGSDAPVIDAVALSGFDATATDFNEHVWYDYPTVARVVEAITEQLAELDPANAGQFERRAQTLLDALDALESRAATLAEGFDGTGAAITEPVPLYLLEALGFVNRTPAAFSEAVEDDTDVPAGVLRETLALFSSHSVALLLYNPQTGGPQTDAVLAAADAAGVPVVAADELLPPGLDYVGWQNALIDEIESSVTAP